MKPTYPQSGQSKGMIYVFIPNILVLKSTNYYELYGVCYVWPFHAWHLYDHSLRL